MYLCNERYKSTVAGSYPEEIHSVLPLLNNYFITARCVGVERVDLSCLDTVTTFALEVYSNSVRGN